MHRSKGDDTCRIRSSREKLGRIRCIQTETRRWQESAKRAIGLYWFVYLASLTYEGTTRINHFMRGVDMPRAILKRAIPLTNVTFWSALHTELRDVRSSRT